MTPAATQAERMVRLRTGADRYGTWERKDVDPRMVRPLEGETGTYIRENPEASLKGWPEAAAQALSPSSAQLGPLLLRATGDGELWLDATRLDGDLPHSLALLVGLRAASVRSWPAVVVRERVEKGADAHRRHGAAADLRSLSKAEEEDDTADDGQYDPAPTERHRIKAVLLAYAAALAAGIIAAGDEELTSLVETGAAYGGAALTDEEVQAIVDRVSAEQADYAAGFHDDLRGGVDELMSGALGTKNEFLDDVGAFMDAAASRASLYAVGGGQPAWRLGVMAGARKAGYAGGTWICTFAEGSCKDCEALHGQWLTWDDFEATWGETECDGACLCGFVPADDPDDLGDEALAEVDDSVEAF